VSLSIVASDLDSAMLSRARAGCYAPASLRELPPALLEHAFSDAGSQYCIRPKYRQGIEFIEQDLRTQLPSQVFDLVLCRNVVFTYFAVPLQRRVLEGIATRLRPCGYMMIGSHEQLPQEVPELMVITDARQIFQKRVRSDGVA
jgi:chemotaxis protein methyltransferase CheR